MGQRTAAEHPVGGTVGGEQLAVNAVFPVDFFYLQQVVPVIAVAAVFVFHLHHDHPAAVGDEMGPDPGQQLPVVGTNLFQIQRVIASQAHVGVGKQPGGQSAEFPFSADIRTGADNDVKSQLFSGFDVFFNIQHAAEVKLTLFAFVEIPAGIGFQRVEAAGFQLFQPVFPIFRHNPEIVHGTGNDPERLSVQQKVGTVISKSVHKPPRMYRQD